MDPEIDALKEHIVSHMPHINHLFEQGSLRDCFSTTTHNKWKTAFDYVLGLETAPSEWTLTSIATYCSSINNQAFNHFFSQSPWDHRALITWIMEQGWRTIGKKGALVIDECGNPKAGKHSVAVYRQYCGNIGKVDNCQVGVCIAYVTGNHRLLLNHRLYIPADWINDPAQCDAAGIPKEHQVFKTLTA